MHAATTTRYFEFLRRFDTIQKKTVFNSWEKNIKKIKLKNDSEKKLIKIILVKKLNKKEGSYIKWRNVNFGENKGD